MTKNNLSEHLSWLLKSTNANAAYRPTTNSPDAVSLLESSNSFVTAQTTGLSTQPPDPVPATQINAANPDAVREFAKPHLPASLSRAQSRDDMARLQAGPKASNKPRLLSETLPASLLAPTPSSVRESSTSLAAQYNRGLAG